MFSILQSIRKLEKVPRGQLQTGKFSQAGNSGRNLARKKIAQFPEENRMTEEYGDCAANGESGYYCNDFEWEDLRNEIEDDHSYNHHFSHGETAVEGEVCSTSTTKDAWQKFHDKHFKGTFFKERKYLLKEFPELLNAVHNTVVLEVGCGSGSSVVPIIRGNPGVRVYACDCSTVALGRASEMVNEAVGSNGASRFHPFYCDFSVENFPNWLHCRPCRESVQDKAKCNTEQSIFVAECPSTVLCRQHHGSCQSEGVDIITLVFTLSSIPYKRMQNVIKQCFLILKPGGMLLFRDYGLYDMTMLRFPVTQKVGKYQYIRSDGTYSYYFTLQNLDDLFMGAGFVKIESQLCCVQLINRRKSQKMRRVWVHAKFQKP